MKFEFEDEFGRQMLALVKAQWPEASDALDNLYAGLATASATITKSDLEWGRQEAMKVIEARTDPKQDWAMREAKEIVAPYSLDEFDAVDLEDHIAQTLRDEREACARVAEENYGESARPSGRIAQAIRTRTDQEQT
jgi:hypothetical protein